MEKDYSGLVKKINYNKGIGKSISDDEQDYYTFAECYDFAVDYYMYIKLGDTAKADRLKEQYEVKAQTLNRKIFKEALETIIIFMFAIVAYIIHFFEPEGINTLLYNILKSGGTYGCFISRWSWIYRFTYSS